ncbi:hypothetical protein LG198_11445 [Methylobacillus arboreus]|uniref:hypothetical protein n=1 Tax=Methylobacillus arboreus TaxID=755170 RepID=UPI001E358850|nr:hypothetical protein [Methylobacillus arboreus]MCB5191342.1 hypothetical protein [Methylobacillus arboreus]
MNIAKSKLFIAVVVVVLAWVVFTQVRMLDGKAIDTAKSVALKEIPNPETAKLENLEEIQHGGKTFVCGQYSTKDEEGNYGELVNFVVEVEESEASRFSDSPDEIAQYCNLPGKR